MSGSDILKPAGSGGLRRKQGRGAPQDIGNGTQLKTGRRFSGPDARLRLHGFFDGAYPCPYPRRVWPLVAGLVGGDDAGLGIDSCPNIEI